MDPIGEIYMIKNKRNSHAFIGQALKYSSGKNKILEGTNEKWKRHVQDAFDKKSNWTCVYLHNDIRMYGEDNFEITKLCDCSTTDEMNEREAHYIRFHKTLLPNGYNICLGGAAMTHIRIDPSCKLGFYLEYTC